MPAKLMLWGCNRLLKSVFALLVESDMIWGNVYCKMLKFAIKRVTPCHHWSKFWDGLS